MAGTLRPMTASAAAEVLPIYQCGMDSGMASYKTVAPS
jgi:hypothetical protein